MARASKRVKEYCVGKGSYEGYWGSEELKDILWDIYRQNHSWGDEWYDKVRSHSYESAKVFLAINGKGENVGKAIDIINRLINLEAEDE